MAHIRDRSQKLCISFAGIRSDIANYPPSYDNQRCRDDSGRTEQYMPQTNESARHTFDQSIECGKRNHEKQHRIEPPRRPDIAVQHRVERALETAAGTVVASQSFDSATRRHVVSRRVVEVIKNYGYDNTQNECCRSRNPFISQAYSHSIQLNGAVINPKTIEMIMVHSARSDIFRARSKSPLE